MKTKTFDLHFRYRDARNELFDVNTTIQATSRVNAKIAGLAMAEERAPEYSGKYWFMSAQPSRPVVASVS